MKADLIPLIAGAIVFVASLISLKLSLSGRLSHSVFGDKFPRICCRSEYFP